MMANKLCGGRRKAAYKTRSSLTNSVFQSSLSVPVFTLPVSVVCFSHI